MPGYGNGLVRVPVTAANTTGVVALNNGDGTAAYAWVTPANSFWSGSFIQRMPRGTVRLTGWTSPNLTFDEVCTTTIFSDLQFVVFVDGVQFKAYQGVGDRVRRQHYVTGMPVLATGSTVEIWAPWGTIPGAQNTGADSPVEGGFVTGVWAPLGYSVAKATASVAKISFGDSIFGASVAPFSINVNPPEVMGVAGQCRLAAQAKGALFSTLDYGGGTACGDGITAAQRAQLAVDVAAAMGATNVQVVIALGRNDWFAGTNTPATVAAYVQAMVNALPSYFGKVVITPIPQQSEVTHGTGTLPTFRTALAAVTGATIILGDQIGLNTTTHLAADGVHLSPLGVQVMTPTVRVPLNI